MKKQSMSSANNFSKACFVSTAPDGPCGGTIKNSTGYITATDFDADGYYDFNLFCQWFIQVEPGKVIIYQFNYILLEDDLKGCHTDFIRVSCLSTNAIIILIFAKT